MPRAPAAPPSSSLSSSQTLPSSSPPAPSSSAIAGVPTETLVAAYLAGAVLPMSLSASSSGAEVPPGGLQLVRLRTRASPPPPPPASQLGADAGPGDVLQLMPAGRAPCPSAGFLRRLVASGAWSRVEAAVPPVPTLAHVLSQQGGTNALLTLAHFCALARARMGASLALLPTGAASVGPGVPPAGSRGAALLADGAAALGALLRWAPPRAPTTALALGTWLCLQAEVLSRAGGAWREALTLLFACMRWAAGEEEGGGEAGAREAEASPAAAAAGGAAARTTGASELPAAHSAGWSWLDPLLPAAGGESGASGGASGAEGAPDSDVLSRALAALRAGAPAASLAPADAGELLLAAAVRAARILTAAGFARVATGVYARAAEALARLGARGEAGACSERLSAEALAALTGAAPHSVARGAGCPPAAALLLARGALTYHAAVAADAAGDAPAVALLVGEGLARLPLWRDAVGALAEAPPAAAEARGSAEAAAASAALRARLWAAALVFLLVGDRHAARGEWQAGQLAFERATEAARRCCVSAAEAEGEAEAEAAAAAAAASSHGASPVELPAPYADVALPQPADLLLMAAMSAACAAAREGSPATGAALLDGLVRANPPAFLRPHTAALLERLYEAPAPQAAAGGQEVEPRARFLAGDPSARRAILRALAAMYILPLA